MSEKPEALRLAEELKVASLGIRGCLEALSADAMLRQHAEIERLKAERDEAVRAEREACAKVIEAQDVDPAFKHRLAAAIRARGEVPR
jgi:predicted NBD/HSP70 family sugar kinase